MTWVRLSRKVYVLAKRALKHGYALFRYFFFSFRKLKPKFRVLFVFLSPIVIQHRIVNRFKYVWKFLNSQIRFRGGGGEGLKLFVIGLWNYIQLIAGLVGLMPTLSPCRETLPCPQTPHLLCDRPYFNKSTGYDRIGFKARLRGIVINNLFLHWSNKIFFIK